MIGIAKVLSKKEKENELGNVATSILELLLKSQGKLRENWNIEKITISYLLTEVLRSEYFVN